MSKKSNLLTSSIKFDIRGGSIKWVVENLLVEIQKKYEFHIKTFASQVKFSSKKSLKNGKWERHNNYIKAK